METVFNIDKLDQMILQLKAEQKTAWEDIKMEIDEIKEDLNPINLIQNTFHEINEIVGFKSNLLQTILSIGAGYLSRKMIIGKSDSKIKTFLGSLLQLFVTKLVAK
jgi:hypothetical protein